MHGNTRNEEKMNGMLKSQQTPVLSVNKYIVLFSFEFRTVLPTSSDLKS